MLDFVGVTTFDSTFAGAASTLGAGAACFVGAGTGVGFVSVGADFSLELELGEFERLSVLSGIAGYKYDIGHSGHRNILVRPQV